MNVQQKVAYAKRAIQSITEHDDAPLEDVAAAVQKLMTFAETELQKAAQRRSQKAAEVAGNA